MTFGLKPVVAILWALLIARKTARRKSIDGVADDFGVNLLSEMKSYDYPRASIGIVVRYG